MQHSFDVELAIQYGIKEAILLNHLYFWIEKNKANNVHYYDNHYWTYNSIKAFKELFPYMSERQINNSLNKLKEQGLIITGNYNKSTYDRTTWYAFTEIGMSIMQKCKMHFTKAGVSIMQKCKMEDTKVQNGYVENVKPIPDNKPNNIADNIPYHNQDDTIYDYVQKNFGRTLKPVEYEEISKWEDNELTRHAIKQAVLNNAYSFRYIESILNNYKMKGIQTIEQARIEDENFKKQKEQKQKYQGLSFREQELLRQEEMTRKWLEEG